MFYGVVRARNCLDVAAFAKTEEYEKMVVATIKMHILMAPKGHSIFWKTTGIDEHMVPSTSDHMTYYLPVGIVSHVRIHTLKPLAI